MSEKRFNGTWKSADGKRRLPFTCTAVAEYRYVSSTFKKLELKGSYPYFYAPAAQKVSKLMYGRIIELHKEFKGEFTGKDPLPMTNPDLYDDISVTIEYYSKDLISLSLCEDSNGGGVHPNTNYYSANYLLTAGAPQLLTLNNLFDPKPESRTKLYNMIDDDLRKQKEDRQSLEETDEALFAVSDLSVYTLTPTDVTFIFSRYVVGSYAEGDYFVTIPLEKIGPSINPAGPLQRFMKK
jgi:hypothetical protein